MVVQDGRMRLPPGQPNPGDSRTCCSEMVAKSDMGRGQSQAVETHLAMCQIDSGSRKFSGQFTLRSITQNHYTFVYPLDTLAPMKDADFRIRVQRELREAFLAARKEQDKSAAQVVREYMQLYVEQNASEKDVVAGIGNQSGMSRK